MSNRKKRSSESSRSWDPVAEWYAGWSGATGSRHHRRIAIPALLDLLDPRPGEHLLDLGCGPGALAPHVVASRARYTGVDLSPRLIAKARRHHGRTGRFVVGDATSIALLDVVGRATHDAVAYLLSIQDIAPLADTLAVAAAALRPGGRLAIVMTHPCFRIPRQSGWGWDPARKLRFRRVDSYLTAQAVPMKRYGPGGRGATRSYHRPLSHYTEALADSGFLVERIHEMPGPLPASGAGRAERRAVLEVPLFMGLRASRAGE